MNYKSIIITCVVLMLVTAGIASAAVTTDTFEDGNKDGWTNGQITTTSIEGSYSIYGQGGELVEWNEPPSVDTRDNPYWTGTIYLTGPTAINHAQFEIVNSNGAEVELLADTDTPHWELISRDGNNNNNYADFSGTASPSTDTWLKYNVSIKDDTVRAKAWEYGNPEPNTWDIEQPLLTNFDGAYYRMDATGETYQDSVTLFGSAPTTYEIKGNVTKASGEGIEGATVYTNTSSSTTTDENGEYSLSVVNGTYNVTAEKSSYPSQSQTVVVNGNNQIVDFTLSNRTLALEGPNFVRPNKTISYKVKFTNSTGEYDVSKYSTVTSNNTTRLTVDSNNLTLEGGAINATVLVKAEYNYGNGLVSTQRTYYISYLQLSNIDTVPPAKWIQAFLGFDDGYAEGQNMKGIGSEIQWLLFTIIIMSVIGKTFDNPWAGIGSGVITAVLLWVLEYISLGLLLSMVFFGIFIGLILVRVRRDGGNEVTINEN